MIRRFALALGLATVLAAPAAAQIPVLDIRVGAQAVMPTGDLRSDGRGRHTTRHRQLLVLRDGSILIDTPGLRELQIWEGDVDSAFADIAVFDAASFRDSATYAQPHQFAAGVRQVVVNGAVSYDGGRFTGERRGRFLTR